MFWLSFFVIGFKKFKKQIKNYFSNYTDLFIQNPLHNIQHLDSLFNQLVMNYYLILMNDPSVSNLNLKGIINQLIAIICLINFCLANNQDPPKTLNENSNEEFINFQGNILANCIKLIEFDLNVDHTQVYFYVFF